MEAEADTASLRKAAAHWSLAGDKQLLDLLQNLHERIVRRCQEANSGLEEMVNTLDTANISLQNVNNKLTALSNSQFVENRVYEDNVDVAAGVPPIEEPPKPTEPTSELSKLRDSLRILEAYHEPVHIVDSDSESVSDEEEDRLVFKPKDLYSDRPLPYIIGSQQWRSKWHAGLVADDSDTDSDTSKVNPPSEQYSESEPDEDDVRTDKPHASQRTISTNSSIGSELTIPTVGKPADIAAELARRLGGNVARIPEPEPESPPAMTSPTKVYRPQQPTAATIFPDEPPPLDACQSDHLDESESEDDVFAELHRAAAHRQTQRSSGAADRLFGNISDVYGRKGGFHDHVDRGRQPNTGAKQPSPPFEEPQDSELFVDDAKTGGQPAYTDTQSDITIKKPIGGISLFGNNHGAKSIGAAILKRNQREISISDDEDEEHQQIHDISDHTEINKAELRPNSKNNIQKDIIDDLFSKSSKTKQTNKKHEKISAVKVEKPVNKKVDLFTDDLFDDIDNIFTNVKPLVTETKQSMKKSLFDDDDDDDLFGDVAAVSNKTSSKPESKGKSIFDSDDELFSEKKNENNAAKFNHGTKFNKASVGEDSLLNEGIENINNVVAKTVAINKVTHTATPIEQSSTVWKTEHEDILQNKSDFAGTIRKEVKLVQDKSSLKDSHVKSILDSDSDDAIFTDHKSSNNYSIISSIKNNTINNTDNKSKPDYEIKENTLRRVEPVSISNIINNDNNTNNEKDKLFEDDPLFKQGREPLNSSKGTLTLHNEQNNTKNNVSIDKFEDNNKKTDDKSIESMEINAAIEKNRNIFTENNLLSSTNSVESKIQNNAVSNLLSNNNISKSLIQSPSLFDEDDDLDDIFSKSSESNIFKEIDTVLQNSTSNQLSKVTMNEDYIRDSNFLQTKESNEVNSEIINEYITHSQTIESNKAEEQVLVNDKPEFFEGSKSKDLTYENNTNLIYNCLEKSEVPIPSGANISYSKSIPDESALKEKKENKTEYDNSSDDFIQREHLFSDIQETISGEPDIFSDIFSDIPPEFDRPKEPKRSKNVNALFDDDSDDEALFFKKNEIVSDDKPDISFTSQDDRLFHIFHNEPPAIDVDFTQTSKNAAEYDYVTLPAETSSEIIASQTDLYGQTKDRSTFNEETRNEPRSPEDSDSEKIRGEAKKLVSKLKPMNLNINVNSLLPGASPKKNKIYEQVDGQVISIKNTKQDEPKTVKSVSFEGDPESEVLDNKLSKERAKIQVKRRPSSRRARKEAVRKSGIDFGDDSTDNSATIDISKKDTDKIENLQASKCERVSNTFKKEALEKGNSDILHHQEVKCSSDVIVEKQVKGDVEQESKLFNKVETNLVEHIINNDNSTNDKVHEENSERSHLTTAFNKRLNVQSKVVYILNDEDIFTDTKPVTNLSHNIKKESENIENIRRNKVLNIINDDDEIFKSGPSKNSNIETLGNVYKDVNLKNNEIDSFDSDEDIFKASQSKPAENTEHNTTDSNNKHKIDKLEAKIDKLFVKTQSTKVKSSLFDDLSDDESELFGCKKNVKNPNITENRDGISTLIKKRVKLPKNDVKTTLFGNESDDDDLFGVRTTKKEPAQPSSRPKEVMSKPTEPVFEDPLSMLTQDEDI